LRFRNVGKACGDRVFGDGRRQRLKIRFLSAAILEAGAFSETAMALDTLGLSGFAVSDPAL